MQKKRFLFVFAAFVAAQLLSPGGSGLIAAQAADAVSVKYAHLGIQGEILTKWADEWAKRVNEETQGDVQVTVYGNAALGNINETIDGVKIGIIGMAMHDFASLAKFVPDLAVFNAPFIYKDAAQSMRVTDPYDSPVMEKLNEELVAKAGIRIIANCYRGARELTSKYPVYSPADMKGKKFRGVPLPIWMSMLKGMGAVPTPVEYSELATSIATGIVDGQENPLNNIYSSKLYEVQPYIMMTNHMQAIQTVFMNEKTWQSIPEKDRAIIAKISQEMGNQSVDWTLSADKELITKLKENGVTFVDESNGLKLDEFRKAVLTQVNQDYPQWTDLIKEIQLIQ